MELYRTYRQHTIVHMSLYVFNWRYFAKGWFLENYLCVLLAAGMSSYVFFEVLAPNSKIASQLYTGDLPAVYALVNPAPAYS